MYLYVNRYRHKYIYTYVYIIPHPEPSPGVYVWDVRPIFNLYSTCISPYPWYPASRCIPVSIYCLCLNLSSNFAADPLYPAVSHCTQLYLYVSSCIQLYPALSHRIPPPQKLDTAKIHSKGGLN